MTYQPVAVEIAIFFRNHQITDPGKILAFTPLHRAATSRQIERQE